MGALDDAFRGLAEELIPIFTTDRATLSRIVSTYNATAGTTSEVTQTVDVHISPPVPFERREIDGERVLGTDGLTYVAAKTLEDKNFDPIPTTNTRITVTRNGVTFKVQPPRVFPSGDQDALIELHLRR